MRNISKKAIMFTVLAVLISALVLATFFTYHSVALDVNVDNSKLRVQSVNKYIDQLDVYLEDMLSATGSKTLFFTSSIMIGNNSYFGNYNSAFVECMVNGKITPISPPWPNSLTINCPDSTYFASKVNYLQNFSRDKLNINPIITINSLTLNQTDPWSVILTLDYTVTINDSYASWKVNKIISKDVSIVGVPDPTYMIVDSSLMSKRYNMNITPYFSSFYYSNYYLEQPSSAHNATINKKYFAWNGAPSFLSRMNNDTTPSACCGITSIVSPANITNQALLAGKCNLDFMFWKNIPLVNTSDYLRYDFWIQQGEEGYYARISYGVYPNDQGLNGSVIPVALKDQLNMTNPNYINFTI